VSSFERGDGHLCSLKKVRSYLNLLSDCLGRKKFVMCGINYFSNVHVSEIHKRKCISTVG